jgi:hypothetical protein
LAFIQQAPDAFQRLQGLSDQRVKDLQPDSIIGFQGVGSGYIVEDAPNEPVLLLIDLDDVKEDRAVTARYARLMRQPHHG